MNDNSSFIRKSLRIILFNKLDRQLNQLKKKKKTRKKNNEMTS